MEPELPSLFRCPISLEAMENPVTISTGVTYERRSIEKWLFTYKKITCPATMQPLSSFDLIPNHALNNLILSWRNQRQLSPPQSISSPSSSQLVQLRAMFSDMESSPFKVSSLKKIRPFTCDNHAVFIASGGVEALRRIFADYSSDFTSFQACEEAVGVLNNLPFDAGEGYNPSTMELLLKPGSIRVLMAILQHGGSEARLDSISILQRLWRSNPTTVEIYDAFKALLDLLSDETSTRLSSSSLDLLLEAVENSKTNRLRSVETGAVRVLIELLPEAGRHRGERTMLLLKRLCECAEGRMAFAEHDLGISVVSSRLGKECDAETKLAVKVLWLICSFLPTKKVVEDMTSCGAVKKLLSLIHVDGQSSTKDKALKMMRMHGDAWRLSPCFPCELRAVLY